VTLLAALGWLLLLAGIVIALWDKRAGRRRRAPEAWDDLTATIAAARVVAAGDIESRSGGREVLWAAQVRFAYSAAGALREGVQTRFFGRDATSLAEAERVVAAYPSGAAVDIAVDPADPDRALIAYDPPDRALLGLGLVVAVIGLLVLMAR
jgi:hypothetical protein